MIDTNQRRYRIDHPLYKGIEIYDISLLHSTVKTLIDFLLRHTDGEKVKIQTEIWLYDADRQDGSYKWYLDETHTGRLEVSYE